MKGGTADKGELEELSTAFMEPEPAAEASVPATLLVSGIGAVAETEFSPKPAVSTELITS